MIFNLRFLFSPATETLEFVVMAADPELIEIIRHPLLPPDDNKGDRGRHVAVLFVPRPDYGRPASPACCSFDYGRPASPTCCHFLVKHCCITLVELVKYCFTHGHMYWHG
ncbi:hypothetical protein VPH35_036811 [Triticum aestivum]